jgi:hypothetical protein
MTFFYQLVNRDGIPVEPPTLVTAVPTWRVGDTISLARDKTLRVIEIQRGQSAEEEPILLVESA